MKKIQTLFMRRVLLLCLLALSPAAIWAYDFEVDDIYYNKLSASTVEVTYKTTSGKSYTMETVVIPATVVYEGTEYTVTAIGYDAFDSSTFSSISLPETITSIGQYAFWKVEKLTEITIPNSVTSMGSDTFFKCAGLTTVVIGAGLETLPAGAFQNCEKLTTVTLGPSLKVIGGSSFSDCISLEEITFPATITDIEGQAFNTCVKLYTITSLCADPPTCNYASFYESLYSNATLYVPYGKKASYVSAAGWQNFKNIEELEEAPLAAGDTFVEDDITYKVVSVEEQTVEVTWGGETSTAGTGTYVGVLTIPVTVSHEDVLYTVIGIGEYAFYQCAALEAIILPDGILFLGANAFAHCTGLRAVTLGNAVVSLDSCSFANCTALEEFYSPVSPSPAAAEAFPDASTSTCMLYVPVGAKGDYSSAEGWEEFSNIVEMTVFFIETLAATDISGTTATLHGTVVAAYNDPIIEKGFEYWTGNEEAQHIVVDGEEMTATVTGLTYATQYTYRAYACTDSGTTYGAALSFTTAESPSSGDDDDSGTGSGISGISRDGDTVEGIYSPSGNKSTTLQKGVRILRYDDGTTKKVLIK